jgi:hypothetical protein
MKIRLVVAELFHVDGQTDMTKLILVMLRTSLTKQLVVKVWLGNSKGRRFKSCCHVFEVQLVLRHVSSHWQLRNCVFKKTVYLAELLVPCYLWNVFFISLNHLGCSRFSGIYPSNLDPEWGQALPHVLPMFTAAPVSYQCCSIIHSWVLPSAKSVVIPELRLGYKRLVLS